jgi:hypothetical protein
MSKKKDLKEALSGSRKADITHMRTPFLVYGSRACEYGDDKYTRGNYAREMATTAEDYVRLRAYLRAAASHILTTLDSMEYHQADDPDLTDVEGMKAAAYAEDTDYKEGQAIGASGLPHLCGAVASLNMAITQATRCGLLPDDPGTPWRDEPTVFYGELASITVKYPDGKVVTVPPQVEKKSATTEEEAVDMLNRSYWSRENKAWEPGVCLGWAKGRYPCVLARYHLGPCRADEED